MQETKKGVHFTGVCDLPEIPMTWQLTEVNDTGSWKTFKPIVDQENCIKCYICWKFCPEPCISINKETGYPEVDYGHCKGCGICANECPKKCIEMELEVIE